MFTVFKLYSNGLLAENRRLARANSSRPASIKKLASWQVGNLANPLFFLLKYYYHWLSISYNNYYLKYVHCQLANLPTCQLPHCYSLLTLIFYGYYPLYVYEFLVSLRIGMVKSKSVIRLQITVFTLLHRLFSSFTLLYAHLAPCFLLT